MRNDTVTHGALSSATPLQNREEPGPYCRRTRDRQRTFPGLLILERA